MRIAVVEDNPRHMQEAVQFLETQGVEVMRVACWQECYKKVYVFSGQFDELRRNIPKPLVDGMITDIYLPLSEHAPHNTDASPVGLVVAALCARAGIPFVFCTSGHHHGSKYEFVGELVNQMGWPHVVDSSSISGAFGSGSTYEDESIHKNWPEAFEKLRKLILKKTETATPS